MMDPKFTAHRGRTVVGGHVENTLEAVKFSIENANVDAIEIDIQITKDGEFVLMNYQTLENVLYDSEPGQKISDFTYDELCKKNFRCNVLEIQKLIQTEAAEYGEYGSRIYEYYNKAMATPAKVATLRDVLSLDRKGKELFVEIKTNYSKEQRQESLDYAKKLLSFCSQFNTENITFIGRDVNTLMAIKEKDSSFDCLPVIGYDDAEKALCDLDGVSVAQNHLKKGFQVQINCYLSILQKRAILLLFGR